MAIEDWTFQNISRSRRKIPVRSIDRAIELFMEASGENEFAISIQFAHLPRGMILSLAGQEYATLAFDPNYDPLSHSPNRFRNAVPALQVTDVDMEFDDGTCASSISAESLLGVLDVIRGIRYILEHHDYPDFLQWRPGC